MGGRASARTATTSGGSDAEELPPAGVSGRDGTDLLAIIPAEAICYLDQDKTLTIVARRDGLSSDPVARLLMDPEGVVELATGTTISLTPHKKREDLVVGHIRIRPLIPELTLLQCEVDARTAEALIDVREERVLPPAPEPPSNLEFERPRYRVGWMKKKTLSLRAPLDRYAEGSTVRVVSDDRGIVVLTGILHLRLDQSQSWLRADVRVDGRVLGAEAEIRASVEAEVASCHALVAADSEGPAVRFELVDEDAGAYRALWKDTVDTSTGEPVKALQIMGRHQALRRYLGPAPQFPGQESPWVKVLIAEIIADNVCREIARRVDAQRTQEERPDADAFYIEHYERMAKLLPKLHTLMMPSAPVTQPPVQAIGNDLHSRADE